MTRLINIQAIKNRAKELGFRVDQFTSHAYIYAPENTGPEAVWHNGAQYSAADFIITDGCNTGYGYNSAFYGPFHTGYCRPDNYGLSKLRAHPLWRDE